MKELLRWRRGFTMNFPETCEDSSRLNETLIKEGYTKAMGESYCSNLAKNGNYIPVRPLEIKKSLLNFLGYGV